MAISGLDDGDASGDVFVSKCHCNATGRHKIIEGTMPPAGDICGVCGRARDGGGRICKFVIEPMKRGAQIAIA